MKTDKVLEQTAQAVVAQEQLCWLGVGQLSMLFLDRGIRSEAWSTGHTERTVQQGARTSL